MDTNANMQIVHAIRFTSERLAWLRWFAGLLLIKYWWSFSEYLSLGWVE